MGIPNFIRLPYICMMRHFTNHSEENYLKTLYKLENKQIKKVNNIALAKSLDLNPATVLEMVRKLKNKKLVDIQPDKSIHLTETGKMKALRIIRRHRIWEVFLVDKLNYKWNEVHELAEQLEHIESGDLIKKLEAFLGYPTMDPHGDPIPDENGRIRKIKTEPLKNVPLNKRVTIVSVANSSNNFLRYMDKHKLFIGDSIKVTDVEEYDNSLTLLVGKNTITISQEAANNILVKI